MRNATTITVEIIAMTDMAILVDAWNDAEEWLPLSQIEMNSDAEVGDVYPIRHAFRLASDAVGSDIGFDVSTRVDAVPTPAPLALLGLGMVGMIGARRFMH